MTQGRSGPQGRRAVVVLSNVLVSVASVALFALLAGCAGSPAYRQGTELVAQGRMEEAIAKFQEAVGQSPQTAQYKAAWIQTRDRTVIAYMVAADNALNGDRAAEAENLFQRALSIDPNNERARAGQRVLDGRRRHVRLLKEAESALQKKDSEAAQLKVRSILAENPSHAGALALRQTLSDASTRPAADAALAASFKKRITIEFRDAPLRQIFEVIARTSGLNLVFDKDVRADQKTSIFLKNSTVEMAMQMAMLTNQLDQQVLDPNTILIYPNSPAKQKDYQEMVVRTFFLANADARTVAANLKSILKLRDLAIDERLNMVIVRDTAEAIRLAEKLVALEDLPEPEVMLELEILEIKRTRLLELGIQWPDSLTLQPLPGGAGGALTLRDLQNINGATIGATVGPFAIHAKKQDSEVKILANPRVRARNREKAKILIGDRVPNITTTATATGFVTESVSYVDVGLKLDVEPTIYLDNDVAIRISMEVSNIVSQLQTKSGSVAYQIGTRTASTVLRLKDGENQVLAGLIDDEDRRAANKVPALGEIPILGRLFGSHSDDNERTEIVLSITPHIVRNIQRPESTLSEFRAGTDSSSRTRGDSGGGPPAASALPPPFSSPFPPPSEPRSVSPLMPLTAPPAVPPIGPLPIPRTALSTVQPTASPPVRLASPPLGPSSAPASVWPSLPPSQPPSQPPSMSPVPAWRPATSLPETVSSQPIGAVTSATPSAERAPASGASPIPDQTGETGAQPGPEFPPGPVTGPAPAREPSPTGATRTPP